MEYADSIRESSASVKGRMRGKGATLIVVEEGNTYVMAEKLEATIFSIISEMI